MVKRLSTDACQKCNGPLCTKSECLKLCLHMYSCDKACYDYNNGHICKHIHRVHSFLAHQANGVDQFQETIEMKNDIEYAESGITPSN